LSDSVTSESKHVIISLTINNSVLSILFYLKHCFQFHNKFLISKRPKTKKLDDDLACCLTFCNIQNTNVKKALGKTQISSVTKTLGEIFFCIFVFLSVEFERTLLVQCVTYSHGIMMNNVSPFP